MDGLQPTFDISGNNNGMGNWAAPSSVAPSVALWVLPGVVVAIGTMVTAAVVVAAAPMATST